MHELRKEGLQGLNRDGGIRSVIVAKDTLNGKSTIYQKYLIVERYERSKKVVQFHFWERRETVVLLTILENSVGKNPNIAAIRTALRERV